MRPHHTICLHPLDDGRVCGTANPAEARVCINSACRARFNVCPHCKTLNRFAAKACRTCGRPLPVLGDLEWRALGGNISHTGCTDDPLDFPIAVKWQFAASEARRRRRFIAGPVVYKGTVYAVALDGAVFSLDQYSGEIRDETGVGAPITATPVVMDTELWLVTREGDLCVLDARAGGQVQESRKLAAGPLSGCVVFDDVVVAASAEGRITAARRGSITETRWTWPRDGSPIEGGLRGGIAAAKDVVVVAGGRGRVLALSQDGELLWEQEAFDEPATVISPPAVDEHCVFVCERSGQCAALRVADGERVWHDVRAPGPMFGGIAVADQATYVASAPGIVSELDAHTGARRRDVDLNDERRPCWCGRCFTGCVAPPTCTPKYVLFGTDSWRVYAWRRGTSRVARILEAGGPIFCAPAVSDGHIYVTTWNGTVWALAGPED